MKKYYLLASLLFGMTLQAKDIKVLQYRHAGPIAISKPILSDKVDIQGKEFSINNLLKTTVSFDKALVSAQEIKADSNGTLSFSAPSDQYALHLFSFYLNSDRFVNGSLEITAPGTFEIYVDGKKQEAKTSMSLEPRRYHVVIKYLAEAGKTPSIQATFKTEEDTEVTASTNPEKRYTLTDVMNGKDVSGARLSADGKYVLINYTNHLPGGKSNSFGQLRTADGKILLQNAELASAQWMPTSNTFYVIRKSLEGNDLIQINPATLEEKVLATQIPEGSFQITPDEKTLLYMIKEDGPKEDKEIIRVTEPADRLAGFRNRYFIWKYDIASSLFQQITFGNKSTYIQDVSTDSRYLLYGTSRNVYTSLPFSRQSLYKLDLQTMEVETIWEDSKYANGATFSPDGKQLLVSGSADAFNNIGLNIKKGQIANSYDGQLFIYDLASKQAKALTRNFNPNVMRSTWSKADGMIYLLTEDRDYQPMYSCNPKTGEFKKLNIPEDMIHNFTIADNAPMMYCYGQSASNANRLYAYDIQNKQSKLIDDLSADKLKDVVLGEVHEWNFKSADGTEIQGRYYLPPHFDPNKKYPMIVNYYGGTSPTGRNMEGRYATHMYAAQGYVVYILNPSGTTGFGQEFAARHVNAWGDKTADEIIRGTELFCKEHAFVDKTKIGCIGASYGGFMTQYLQTKTDLFAAAISHAGISALSSYWGEGYWGIGYCSVANANTYPWNDPEFYTEHSPLFRADKIKTPLLLLHGNADTNVPVGESIQMFAAMKILGKEVEFVQVDGQDHHILDYSKRTKWQNTIFAWFAKHLKGQPEWWNSLYPKRNF